jgi:hypothetical protein
MSRFPKIGSRVLEFTSYAGVFTLASLGYAKVYGKSEEDKQKELKEKFPELVGRSKEQKQAMQQFFNSVKDNKDDTENQKKFDQLLHAGKGKVKRQPGNVGIEADIKAVPKPAVIPLKEKVKAAKEKEAEKKKGWLW